MEPPAYLELPAPGPPPGADEGCAYVGPDGTPHRWILIQAHLDTRDGGCLAWLAPLAHLTRGAASLALPPTAADLCDRIASNLRSAYEAELAGRRPGLPALMAEGVSIAFGAGCETVHGRFLTLRAPRGDARAALERGGAALEDILRRANPWQLPAIRAPLLWGGDASAEAGIERAVRAAEARLEAWRLSAALPGTPVRAPQGPGRL